MTDAERQGSAGQADDEEFRRATANIRGQLEERHVRLHDADNAEGLADLLSAVEGFEAAVRRRGGDSYTNTPDATEPDDRSFVLPARGDDEQLAAYRDRVAAAADRITPSGGVSDR